MDILIVYPLKQNFFVNNLTFLNLRKRQLKQTFASQGIKLDENNRRIFIPKVGYIRYRKSQLIAVGVVKNVAISLVCGKRFICIQTEYEQAEPIHQSNTEIGIDMGISRFATLPNGNYFEPLNIFKQNQLKLKKLQQQLSHKKKFSQNWIKSKRKISELHHKIANSRKDYLHKISHEISKNHAMIYTEDLKGSNMSNPQKAIKNSMVEMSKQNQD